MLNRQLRLASWLLFAATMYLILEEAVWPWLRLPGLGNIGFTLVFVLFAVVHCAAVRGPRFTGLFFAVSAVVCYLMEEIGVRTGLIYGRYHYGDMLGPKLGDVPVVIPLAYFMMIYCSWRVAKALLGGVDTRSIAGLTAQAVAAAFVMTAWDMVMDPGMAADGNWIWENGGAYFGVPRHNYLGWLLTTFLVYWITGWLTRNSGKRFAWASDRTPTPASVLTHEPSSARLPETPRIETIFHALPILVYGFFAVRYVASNEAPALQLIAIFSMGTPAVLAVARVFLIGSDGAYREVNNHL